jgi:hypothetical protein
LGSGIRDKHPGSATLGTSIAGCTCPYIYLLNSSVTLVFSLLPGGAPRIWRRRGSSSWARACLAGRRGPATAPPSCRAAIRRPGPVLNPYSRQGATATTPLNRSTDINIRIRSFHHGTSFNRWQSCTYVSENTGRSLLRRDRHMTLELA